MRQEHGISKPLTSIPHGLKTPEGDVVAKSPKNDGSSTPIPHSASATAGHTDPARTGPSVMMVGSRGIPNVQGGVEKHIEMIGSELVALGWQVTVIGRRQYLQQASQTVWQGVRVVPLWAPRAMSLEAIGHSIAAIFYAAVHRPDVVHIHAVGPALVTPLARLFGLKVVVTHHGYDYDRQKWGSFAKTVLKLGEAFGMYAANRKIAISQEIVDTMRQKYRVAVDLIPNGVATHQTINSTQTLETFGLTPRGYIIMVARIVPEKRQHDLLVAYSMLNCSKKLVIVGDADHESDYSVRVRALAAQNPSVVMTGFQTGDALAELFGNAALFVLPSSHEGMPIALLEARSYGLPVLASNITANLALNLAEEDYFPLGNVDALASAIKRKLASPFNEEEAERMRQSESDYSWTKIAKRTAEIYRSILPNFRR